MKNYFDPNIDPPSKVYRGKEKNVEVKPGSMSVTIIKVNDNQIDEDTLTFNNVARVFLSFKDNRQVVNIWTINKLFLLAQIPSEKILIMDISNAQPTVRAIEKETPIDSKISKP